MADSNEVQSYSYDSGGPLGSGVIYTYDRDNNLIGRRSGILPAACHQTSSFRYEVSGSAQAQDADEVTPDVLIDPDAEQPRQPPPIGYE